MASVARNVHKLYVANIPWTVGNVELKQYFSKFGQVSNASVIFDKNTGLSKNFGFVLYANFEGIDTACKCTEHKLEGNILKVQVSQNP